MWKNLRIPALVALAGAALGGTSANATPYAFASNEISGLTIRTWNPVTDQYGPKPISPTSATVTISDDAQFDAFPVSGFASGGNLLTSIHSGNLITRNITEAEAGPGPFPPENTFVPAGPPGTFTGARSDASLSGGNVIQGGANVDNVAEGYGPQVYGTSTAFVQSSVSFSLVGSGLAVRLDFTDAYDLIAATAALPGETATAAISNTFSITPVTSGTPLATYDPTVINKELASIDGVPGYNQYEGTVILDFITPVLTKGVLYNISLSSQSTESVIPGVPIPAPAGLAVLGAGLVGLGLLRRRG
jgi:hypothetical protein